MTPEERKKLREAALEARNALSIAEDALSRCYDVGDWPADGTTDQDLARKACELAFKRLDEATPLLDALDAAEARVAGAVEAERAAKADAIVEAARGLCFGTDWNTGAHAKLYRQALIDAVAAMFPDHPTAIRSTP